MRLTTYTDYTLRTLIFLALRPERLATIAEIAEIYTISENHLTKIVHRLGLAGDVQTVRGRSGGIRLARAPEAINLGAMVRRTEPDFAIATCFEKTSSCPLHSVCVLEKALAEAAQAFLAILERYTLADLIAPRLNLQRALGIAPPKRSLATARASSTGPRRQARSGG